MEGSLVHREGGVVWTAHLVYALHAWSLVAGIIGAATVVGSFLMGWPSIIAVIVNYVKRADARGTYVESHFRWQIRTFWFAALWCVVAGVLFLTIIGIPFAFGILFATGIWAMYRIVRGWLALRDRRPMYA